MHSADGDGADSTNGDSGAARTAQQRRRKWDASDGANGDGAGANSANGDGGGVHSADKDGVALHGRRAQGRQGRTRCRWGWGRGCAAVHVKNVGAGGANGDGGCVHSADGDRAALPCTSGTWAARMETARGCARCRWARRCAAVHVENVGAGGANGDGGGVHNGDGDSTAGISAAAPTACSTASSASVVPGSGTARRVGCGVVSRRGCSSRALPLHRFPPPSLSHSVLKMRTPSEELTENW